MGLLRLILFDLDGTLGYSSLGAEFADAILFDYARFISENTGIGTKRIAKAILEVIIELKKKPPKPKTITEAFLELLGKKLDESKAELEIITNKYYEMQFDKFGEFYKPIPGAREILIELFKQNLKIGIATDPITKRPGVLKRLQWANLIDLPFHYITSADNMHAAKPHPLFYKELLEIFNVAPHETIMVGDKIDNDIIPAKSLGITTIYIGDLKSENLTVPDYTISNIKQLLELLRKEKFV